jgi:hypothetical protein
LHECEEPRLSPGQTFAKDTPGVRFPRPSSHEAGQPEEQPRARDQILTGDADG